MISAFVRRTRVQRFRHGNPPLYSHRSIANAAVLRTQRVEQVNQFKWQAHTAVPSNDHDVIADRPRLQKLQAESSPRSFSSFLTDNYSREHNYLRISLTERCNLRCLYCMPEEGIQLSPPDHILTTPEIIYLASLFVDQGVNKIRLTGGEPTVRKDILDLMQQLGQLRNNGLKELCLTTNGISLHRKLDSMVESGLTGVNLSLDTLDPFQFTIMTRRNGHEAVMKSINRILEMNKLGAGIKLKINCVVMRGLNDNEILPFVELGKENDLEVRFIEYMPFDGNKWSQNKMLSFQEMLALIKERHPDVAKVQDHINDTSKTYKVPGFAGRIGFITSMTHNFCGTCNRLRITSDGNLKVCLFGNSEVSLRDILRESNNGKPIDSEAMEAIKRLESDRRRAIPGSTGVLGMSDREAKLLDVIGVAVKRKKEKHAGMGELENMKNRPMILIDKASHPQGNHTAYQVYSPLRQSSPLITFRSPTAFSKSIPVHLLSFGTQPSGFHQHRYRSTSLLKRTYVTRKPLVRQVFTLGTHRYKQYNPLDHLHTRENVERKRRVQHALGQAVSQIIRRANFATRELRAPRSVWEKYDCHRPAFIATRAGFATSGLQSDSKPSISTDVPTLSHLTSSGQAHMIDVGHKRVTWRSASAVSHLTFSSDITYQALMNTEVNKGDAVAVSRIAGIQAAKKAADLIPLAHPSLTITAVRVDIRIIPTTEQQKQMSDDAKNVTSQLGEFSHVPGFDLQELGAQHGCVQIISTVECWGKTGIEMEALTSANVAALTMFDMLKGIDKNMSISQSRVIEKKGGKTGTWRWNSTTKKLENTEQTSSVPEGIAAHDTALHKSRNHAKREPEPADSTPNFPSSSIYIDGNEHNASLPTTKPSPSTLFSTSTEAEDSTAQSVFEAEWADLTTSFASSNLPTQTLPNPKSHTYQPLITPNTNSNSSTSNKDNYAEEPDTEVEQWRGQYTHDILDAVNHNHIGARSFRNARVERYKTWRKNN